MLALAATLKGNDHIKAFLTTLSPNHNGEGVEGQEGGGYRDPTVHVSEMQHEGEGGYRDPSVHISEMQWLTVCSNGTHPIGKNRTCTEIAF